VGERGLTNVLNVPGEFIPRCGCTADVIAAELGDITIAGKPLTEGHALIVSIGEEDGSTRVTLNLSAGHRVRVRQQPDWHPIETAPKDGTSVLLWAKDLRFPGEMCVAQYITRDIEWWHVTDGKFGPWPLRGPSPTHWQPLSIAPSGEGDRS
jgi:hypothetical protein